MVILVALVPFLSALLVFSVMANLGLVRQRVLAAAIIGASRVALDAVWLLVLDPLLGTLLGFIPFAHPIAHTVLALIIVYIVTLTCIEKVLDVDLDYAHNVAMSVVVVTAIAWLLLDTVAIFRVLMG